MERVESKFRQYLGKLKLTGVVERITGWDRKVCGVSLVPAALSIASVGVALSLAAGARAQEQNLSKFKFTADNQAQIFLNGELLGGLQIRIGKM